MIRKSILLAALAMMLAALGASMAHGEIGIKWKKSGSELTADASIEATGLVKFSNATLGGIECPVLAKLTLTKGTSTADITSYSIEKTSECKLNGLLNLECENLSSHEYTFLGWKATGTKTGAVHVTGHVVTHYRFTVKPGHTKCPSQVTYESTETAFPTATLDSTTAATKMTLSGSLTTTGAGGEDLGSSNVTGTLSILAPNSGLFGIG